MGPVPAWVEQTHPAITNSSTAASDFPDGTRYDLVDDQIHAERAEYYSRVVRSVLNESGVQNGSSINISFDPAYQKLTLHTITIKRGDEILNRLNPEQLRLIQQEENLESHIYDGELSLVTFLEDVRVNDQIEYAFTLKGDNPILAGNFADSFYMEWAIPVEYQRMRLIWPKTKKVYFKNHNSDLQPTVSSDGEYEEYLWERPYQAALIPEDGLPYWYNPFQWIQLSQFADWSSVTYWALPLYSTTQPLSPALADKIATWKKAELSEQELFNDILRFTQDEIRYLGIEIGPNSHRPTAPSVVFERRFGDCKDKTLLLCTILKELGMEAVPALVNTYNRHTVTNWHPSPYAFNHVIARVKSGKEYFYVDPTTSSQRGPVHERYRPNYGYCLLVEPGSDELTPIPTPTAGLPKTTVTEKFTIASTNYSSVVKFEIATVSERLSADNFRRSFAESSLAELEKNYLDYYARIYPGISRVKPVDIHDDVEANRVTVREAYEITNFWKETSQKGVWRCEVYPQEMRDIITAPDSPLRKMPFRIAHPKHLVYRTEIKLPEYFPVEDDTVSIVTTANRLDHSARYDKRTDTLLLRYEYKSLADFVAVEDIPDYLKKHEEMLGQFGYYVTKNLKAISSEETSTANGLRLLVIGLIVLYAIILLIGSIVAFRFLPKPALVPPPLPGELRGIRGWLLLVALGVIANPLIFGFNTVETAAALDANTWHNMVTPGNGAYHQYIVPLILFEVASNIFLFFCSTLLVVLFFTKRRMFPKLMIIFMFTVLAFQLADTIFSQQIDFIAKDESNNGYRDIGRAFIKFIIWSSYFTKSVRVKNTFIR